MLRGRRAWRDVKKNHQKNKKKNINYGWKAVFGKGRLKG